MSGKVIALVLMICSAIAGGGLYYLQVYGFYDEVLPGGASDVLLTTLRFGMPEPINHEEFQAIDAESSPLRYRACFMTHLSLETLAETYVVHDDPVPNVAPGWFRCFDAAEIGAALEDGSAIAFLGTRNVAYGFDRVVAVSRDGHGFVWHQLNRCGERYFNGKSLPEDCPPPSPRESQ
ncbi:MAG: histidine kinase [Boseongicola sp. SB0664_bin_43]|uniref:Histidine kinase n=1 Tax=Boseongicola sp. SB0664_bin_43 TaxID=2604844 RepID=A0A6B0XZF3_9RHOB|nr:histidine kinase [Boseongicola sp. SB0664_bin_43]MYK33106.1 histidine kinase [Boseongicola sp. SB0670_bin_30]